MKYHEYEKNEIVRAASKRLSKGELIADVAAALEINIDTLKHWLSDRGITWVHGNKMSAQKYADKYRHWNWLLTDGELGKIHGISGSAVNKIRQRLREEGLVNVEKKGQL